MTKEKLTSLIIEDIIAEIPIEMDGDEQEIREEMSALIYSHVERYHKQVIDKACSWLKRELAYPMPDIEYELWCEEKLEDFKKELLNVNKE